VAPLGFAAAFLYGVLDNGALALLPVYGSYNGWETGGSALLVSAATIGAISCQLPIGWVVDKLETHLIYLGCIVGVAVLLLLLPNLWPYQLLTAFAVFLLGGLMEGFYTVGLADVGKRAPAIDLSMANACFVTMCGAGEVVGPVLAGIGIQQNSSHGLILMMTEAILVFAIVIVFYRRTRHASLS
jgi:MFS family permease